MFARIKKSGKYQYLQIVQNRREGPKTIQRVIATIGRMDKLQAKGEVETPIRRELSQIFNHSIASHHVILIDDARLFIGDHDWPTIEELRNMSSSAGFDAFKVKHDVIRIHKLASSSK